MATTIFEGTTKAGMSKEVRHTGRDCEAWVGGKLVTTGHPTMISEIDRKGTYAKAPKEAVMAIGPVLFLADEAALISDALDRIEADARAIFVANVPGLDLLRAALADHEDYGHRSDRMMEDEDNDGVNPPRRPTSDPESLRAQYPRAAMWMKASAYEEASNFRKSAAGREARKLIESGGDLDEASKVLENWLPASAMWD